jgi:hypothetical protein
VPSLPARVVGIQVTCSAAGGWVAFDLAGKQCALELVDANLGGSSPVLNITDSVGGGSLTINCRGASILQQNAITAAGIAVDVSLYDSSSVALGSIVGAAVVPTITVFSPSASVHQSYYADVSVVGVYVDQSGAGLANIDPTTSSGAVLVDSTTGSLYVSVASAWKPLAAGAPVSLVFQPTGAAAGNVYTTEATLAAATQALNGALYSIFYDLSLVGGSYTFTTVGSLNLAYNGIWTDADNGYTLVFSAGTTLPNPPQDVRGALEIEITQAATLSAPTTISPFVFVSEEATIRATGGAYLDSTSPGGTVTLRDQASAGGSSSAFAFIGTTILLRDQVEAQQYLCTGAHLLFAQSVAANVDPSLYPILGIDRLYIDLSGTGVSTIPAQSGVYLLSGGVIYFGSTAPAWEALGSTALAGTITLSAGVASATVSDMPVSAVVVLTLKSVNASTALGVPRATVVSTGVGGTFSVTSVNPASLATQTGDLSTYYYVIVPPEA